MQTKTKKPELPPLENLGSLITYTLDGQSLMLGSLMDFKEKGVWDARWGKVPVTPEQAAEHNRLLDEALLEGLDNRCDVGQGGYFYVREAKPGAGERISVTLFTGVVVADADHIACVKKPGQKAVTVTFERKGKTFRGKWKRSEGDHVFFKRIA